MVLSIWNAALLEYTSYVNHRTDETSGIQPQSALGLWSMVHICVALVFWRVPLHYISQVEGFPLTLLVGLYGLVGVNMKSL